jgi:hypothetical protein
MEDPKCEKCGAPISTGLMALLCPGREECALWVDGDPEFAAMFPDTWTPEDKQRFREHCSKMGKEGGQ